MAGCGESGSVSRSTTNVSEYASAIRIEPGRVTAAGLGVRPLDTEKFGWKNFSEVERDIANLQSGLHGFENTEAFLPAVAVGQVLFMIPSTCYTSDQAYLYDLADVLKRKYRAIVDAGFVLQVDAPAYSSEAANPHHAHEWEVWQEVTLPEGKILIPGVIDSVSTIVEHPDLVAQRIVQYARMVGRENVIAAPDSATRGRTG